MIAEIASHPSPFPRHESRGSFGSALMNRSQDAAAKSHSMILSNSMLIERDRPREKSRNRNSFKNGAHMRSFDGLMGNLSPTHEQTDVPPNAFKGPRTSRPRNADDRQIIPPVDIAKVKPKLFDWQIDQ